MKQKMIIIIALAIFGGLAYYFYSHSNPSVATAPENINDPASIKEGDAMTGTNSIGDYIKASKEGFVWYFVKVNATSTGVVARFNGKFTPIAALEGSCIVEQMYDAPKNTIAGLVTPVIHCTKLPDHAYITAHEKGSALEIRAFVTKEQCTDYTTCDRSNEQTVTSF